MSSSRRSLASLIDSDDGEEPEVARDLTPSSNSTLGSALGLYRCGDKGGKVVNLKKSLRSPQHGNSFYPPVATKAPIHISGSSLRSELETAKLSKEERAERIFNSMFPDSSESEDGGEGGTVAEMSGSSPSSEGIQATSQTPGQLNDMANSKEIAKPPSRLGSTFGTYPFEADVRPSLDAPTSRQEEPIPLAGAGGILDSSVPAHAARYLKEYQVLGVRWLWNKYINRQGGVLGDDMGLGKTIQVIALLLAIFGKTGTAQDAVANREKRKHGSSAHGVGLSLPGAARVRPGQSSAGGRRAPPAPCLIICPASVVTNWMNELHKWGYFLVDELGTYDDVTVAINRASEGRCDIVLGSYAKLRMNIDDLAAISWSCVFWDEGHCLKGEKTQLYAACEKLVNVRCRFILSGTIVQNRLEELWPLLNILNKGVVHTKESFKEHFVVPIKHGEARNAAPEAVALGNKRQKELQKLVSKYMLQRFKEVELAGDLKSKDDIVVFCSLSPLQKQMYQHILSLPDFDNCRFYDTPCPCGSGHVRRECCTAYSVPLTRGSSPNPNLEVDRSAYTWRKGHRISLSQNGSTENCFYCSILSGNGSEVTETYEPCKSCPCCVSLPCIQVLLKVASHPLLFQVDSSIKDSKKNQEKMEFLKYCLTPDIVRQMGGAKFLSGSAFDQSNNELSGKMIILEKLLENFTGSRLKTLLFSYSTKTLTIIENYIRSKGWSYLRLDGSTPGSERQGLVDRFNGDQDLPIFLISTRAGGMGLNLTSATKVIIFDCSWNPTSDMQAQDRCYRYGQTKQVTVYRLVAQGTVEELIYMRQLYKQAMQETAIPQRPDLPAQQNNGSPEGGIAVQDSQEDEECRGGSVYTAKRKHVGEGKRAFCGIEKEKDYRGELFGLENLLQYEDDSILGILRKKYMLDGCMAGGDASDNECEVSAVDNSTPSSKRAARRQNGNVLHLNTLNQAAALGILAADARSGESSFVQGALSPRQGGDDEANMLLSESLAASPERKKMRPSPSKSLSSQLGSSHITSEANAKDPDFLSDDDGAATPPPGIIAKKDRRSAQIKKKTSSQDNISVVPSGRKVTKKKEAPNVLSSLNSSDSRGVISLYKPHYML